MKLPLVTPDSRLFLDSDHVRVPQDNEFYFYSFILHYMYRDDPSAVVLPEYVVNDCILNKARIIIDHTWEHGSAEFYNEFISILLQKFPKLDYMHFVVLTSNLEINMENVKCNVIADVWFESIVGNAINNVHDVNFLKEKNNNFFAFLGRPSAHRLMMLSKLVDLQAFGVIGCSTRRLEQNLALLDTIYPDICYKFYNKNIQLPILHDLEHESDFDNDMSVSTSYKNICEQSYVNICTETYYNNDNTVWFTEKTFKSVEMLVPFILHGPPHSLKKFKSFGYKTFDNWWDESYDNEFDLQERMLKIHNLLDDVLTRSDLNKVYADMKDTLIYNHQLRRKRKEESSKNVIQKLYNFSSV